MSSFSAIRDGYWRDPHTWGSSTQFPIVSASNTLNQFIVTGDATAITDAVYVFSDNNNGAYPVASTSYNAGTNQTTINLDFAPNDAGAGGYAYIGDDALIPQDGDDVTVANDFTVTLDTVVAALNSLTVGGGTDSGTLVSSIDAETDPLSNVSSVTLFNGALTGMETSTALTISGTGRLTNVDLVEASHTPTITFAPAGQLTWEGGTLDSIDAEIDLGDGTLIGSGVGFTIKALSQIVYNGGSIIGTVRFEIPTFFNHGGGLTLGEVGGTLTLAAGDFGGAYQIGTGSPVLLGTIVLEHASLTINSGSDASSNVTFEFEDKDSYTTLLGVTTMYTGPDGPPFGTGYVAHIGLS